MSGTQMSHVPNSHWLVWVSADQAEGHISPKQLKEGGEMPPSFLSRNGPKLVITVFDGVELVRTVILTNFYCTQHVIRTPKNWHYDDTNKTKNLFVQTELIFDSQIINLAIKSWQDLFQSDKLISLSSKEGFFIAQN